MKHAISGKWTKATLVAVAVSGTLLCALLHVIKENQHAQDVLIADSNTGIVIKRRDEQLDTDKDLSRDSRKNPESQKNPEAPSLSPSTASDASPLEEERDPNNFPPSVFEKFIFKPCRDSCVDHALCSSLADVLPSNNLSTFNTKERKDLQCPPARLCFVLPPKGYRPPVPWPESREKIYAKNVYHPTKIIGEWESDKWMSAQGEYFKFPGGGSAFPAVGGADSYVKKLIALVPGLGLGKRTRTVLDVGCGVASFAGALFRHGCLTLSFAPLDSNVGQIQVALERGLPAVIGALNGMSLPYAAQAFDVVHCGMCRVAWTEKGGKRLVEVDRVLRGGGYFIWLSTVVGGRPTKSWEEMKTLGEELCWSLVVTDGTVAVWQKPEHNRCPERTKNALGLRRCANGRDSDPRWRHPLANCTTPLPETGWGTFATVPPWPARLTEFPARLADFQLGGVSASREIWVADTKYWKVITRGYLAGLGIKKKHLRNVMDMNANLGGFASALVGESDRVWVMNVVPAAADIPNTLPLISDRGLIAIAHDWCLPFNTYPRTYDLVHAAFLVSQLIKSTRCPMATLVVEIDRILRPQGHIIIRDRLEIIQQIKFVAEAMLSWNIRILDSETGPLGQDKLLYVTKRLQPR